MHATDGVAVLLFVGALHVALGAAGTASRRSLTHVALGAATTSLGVALILVAWSTAQARWPGRGLALLMIVIACTYAVLFAALRERWFATEEDRDVDCWNRLRSEETVGSSTLAVPQTPSEERHV